MTLSESAIERLKAPIQDLITPLALAEFISPAAGLYMAPVGAPTNDARLLHAVLIVIPLASPEVTAPIVSPANVAPAAPRHPPIQPPLLQTKDVSVVGQHWPEGVTPEAKKPAGYVSVIAALYDSHTGVNDRVMLTPVLLATRSQSDMNMETSMGADDPKAEPITAVTTVPCSNFLEMIK